jgi:hypothetical protein
MIRKICFIKEKTKYLHKIDFEIIEKQTLKKYGHFWRPSDFFSSSLISFYEIYAN